MTRISVILALLLAACDVGDVTHGQGGVDGSGSGGCVNMTTPLSPQQHSAPVDPAKPSNPGQNCMQANCHNMAAPGTGASPFTFGGTHYTTPAGTTGVGGATVRITFSGGSPVKAVTHSDGNFYSVVPISYPATAEVTSCPTLTPMTGTLQTGNGGCNGGACHAVGGVPGPIGLSMM
jgi:hypothetical protein